jgi:hypothetical protein
LNVGAAYKGDKTMGTMEQTLQRDLANKQIRIQERKAAGGKRPGAGRPAGRSSYQAEKIQVNHWLQLWPWIRYDKFVRDPKPAPVNNWKKS